MYLVGSYIRSEIGSLVDAYKRPRRRGDILINLNPAHNTTHPVHGGGSYTL